MGTLSSRNLSESIDHPLYEMEMMLRAAAEHPKQETTILKNTMLESFLVHIRCLDEFFREGKVARNMNARDFLPKWTPRLAHPDVDRLNREISHLGWSRKKPGTVGDGWVFADVMRPIAVSALAFLRDVRLNPDLLIYPGIRDRVEQLIADFRWAEAARPLFDANLRQTAATSTVIPFAVTTDSAGEDIPTLP